MSGQGSGQGSVVDQLVAVFHFLSDTLASRLARALNLLWENQASASLAAVAGLAISLFFAWRLSRLHLGHRRGAGRGGAGRQRQEKQQGSDGAQAQGQGSGSLPGAASPEAALGPVLPLSSRSRALTERVRQQLAGAKKVTLHVLGTVVCIDASGAALGGGESPSAVEESVRDVVLELGRQADVYLMAQVNSDAAQAAVTSALKEGRLLGPGSPLNQYKLLFCSTDTGIMSFVRQLEPDLHIDASNHIVQQLERFVKRQLHVGAGAGAGAVVSPKVQGSPSLSAFFGVSPPPPSSSTSGLQEA